MNVQNIDHLNLSVNNFEETVQWYQNVFDFKLVEEGVIDGVKWGVIRANKALLCIYEHGERTLLNGDQLNDKKIHGFNHFSFRIENRKEWEEKIKKYNIKINYDGLVRWPHSNAWYVNDPTGYEIEVVLWDDDQIKFD